MVQKRCLKNKIFMTNNIEHRFMEYANSINIIIYYNITKKRGVFHAFLYKCKET